MSNNVEFMKTIREEQLTSIFHSLIFVGFFVLSASLSRVFFMGWHNFMFIHIGSYLAIIGIAVFKNHIPHVLKTYLLVIIMFILSVAGLVKLGLVGYGIGLLFIFCIVSTIFFSTRGGIIAAILSALTIAIVGSAVVKGAITFNFDIAGYIKSPATWLLGTVGMILFTGLIVTILSKINRQLIDLVHGLNSQNAELKDANKKLEDALEEKKRLKIGLEQAQKMELVGTIAGGVVHDLNNMLASSINFPEILLAEIPEKSQYREPLEIIKNSGLKAAAIVQDLLTLARRGVPVKEVFNLNDIVQECITSPVFEKIKTYHPNLELDIHMSGKLWNTEGSPLHLTKTVTNLLSNAAEAMPDGGKISIKTENCKIHPALHFYESIEPGEYVLLSVSDTGTGISEKDKEKIFEPFYTKKKMGRSGTGLGMTVVWNTVKDHNGHIKMNSIEGKGTTFSIFIPMTDNEVIQPEPSRPVREYIGHGESILVVDDVEEQRKIALTILSALGYSVNTASSGEEAIEYIKSHPTDLVLLDMIMPVGMDGLDTYKKILTLRPHQKALIISGFSKTNRIRKALELGAGAYIKKPYLMENVASAVRAELDKGCQNPVIYN